MKNKLEKIDLTCPKCHATMEQGEEEDILICPFCRHKVKLDQEEDINKLAEKERKLSYARMEGENLAKEKSERRKGKRIAAKRMIKKIIKLLIAVGIIYAIYRVGYLGIPFMEDPFQNVRYEFSGVNGSGKIDLTIDSSIKDQINYKVSKSEDLSNGEIITIRASSVEYRLGTKEKKIQVQGLYKKLTAFSDLTNEMKEFIHGKTCAFQKNEIENGVTFKGKLYELRKYKMYLDTDGKNKSYLYDVYVAKIKSKNGKIFNRYVVTEYKNIVIINEKNDLLRYGGIEKIGKSILAGDNSKNYCRLYDWL